VGLVAHETGRKAYPMRQDLKYGAITVARTQLNIPPLAQSCGKARYHSAIELNLAETRLSLEDRARGREPITMRRYWCGSCAAYHLTRKASRTPQE
jgi:hypothetical protein